MSRPHTGGAFCECPKCEAHPLYVNIRAEDVATIRRALVAADNFLTGGGRAKEREAAAVQVIAALALLPEVPK